MPETFFFLERLLDIFFASNPAYVQPSRQHIQDASSRVILFSELPREMAKLFALALDDIITGMQHIDPQGFSELVARTRQFVGREPTNTDLLGFLYLEVPSESSESCRVKISVHLGLTQCEIKLGTLFCANSSSAQEAHIKPLQTTQIIGYFTLWIWMTTNVSLTLMPPPLRY